MYDCCDKTCFIEYFICVHPTNVCVFVNMLSLSCMRVMAGYGGGATCSTSMGIIQIPKLTIVKGPKTAFRGSWLNQEKQQKFSKTV